MQNKKPAPALLSFTAKNIGEYENGSLSFSFVPLQRVYDDVPSDSAVKQLTKAVYDSKILALVGSIPPARLHC